MDYPGRERERLLVAKRVGRDDVLLGRSPGALGPELGLPGAALASVLGETEDTDRHRLIVSGVNHLCPDSIYPACFDGRGLATVYENAESAPRIVYDLPPGYPPERFAGYFDFSRGRFVYRRGRRGLHKPLPEKSDVALANDPGKGLGIRAHIQNPGGDTGVAFRVVQKYNGERNLTHAERLIKAFGHDSLVREYFPELLAESDQVALELSRVRDRDCVRGWTGAEILSQRARHLDELSHSDAPRKNAREEEDEDREDETLEAHNAPPFFVFSSFESWHIIPKNIKLVK